MNSAKMSLFTSFSLKLVGTILILASLLDYIILAIPFRYQQEQWLVGFITQVVDRGIIPMIGIVFVIIAYWIDSNIGSRNTTNHRQDACATKSFRTDLRLPMFVLASVLGLVFFGLVAIYLNSLRIVSSETIATIEEQVQQANEELDQFDTLLEDPQSVDRQVKELDLILETGQLQGQQLSQQQLIRVERGKQFFESLQANPEDAEKRIKERRTQLLNTQKEGEKRTKTETLKRGLRIGLSSLMLGGVYSAIGWLGLKGLGSSTSPGRKVPKR